MADRSEPLSPPLTASTKNFRESTHLIPAIKQKERPKSFEPPSMKLWVIIPAALVTVALGIGLEVALYFSNKNSGFSVREQNIFKFASTQFLTSFVPIAFVAPFVFLWDSKSWLVKRYQPYVNLARKDTTAEDSLLLDYVSINKFYCLYIAYVKQHWLVFLSSLAAIAALLLQPLAGSIFDVNQFPHPQDSSAFSIRTLGLDPDRLQLTAFLAAAGYVIAAVSNNLPDPPFVHNNWATADFQAPFGNYLNGTINVNTTGVRTNATCSAPSSLVFTTSNLNLYSISATSSSGCSTEIQFVPESASQQYGVTNVSSCNEQKASLSAAFQPVFFWFFHADSASSGASNPMAAGVFCDPTLEVYNVNANASLNDGSLGNVTIVSPFTDSSNVTGDPLNGIPFNGVIFDPSPDGFVAARANATNSGVPGAILRSVLTNSSLSINAFNSLDGFVDQTSRIYTQHLALVAKNTYFLQQNATIPAVIISLRPRLVVEPLAGHALSVFLILIGLTMIFVGIAHHQVRKGVYLASAPGSIASAVTLTSHSGFGMFLNPFDTDASISKKLSPLRFRLDHRTGAILAVDAPGTAAANQKRYHDESDNENDVSNSKNEKSGKPLLSRGSTVLVGSDETSYERETRQSLLGHARPLSQPGYIVEPFTPPPRDESPSADREH